MENKIWLLEIKVESIEQIKAAAHTQRSMIAGLMSEHPMTYSQILFPYADERNVFTAAKLDEKPLFGTHLLVSGVEKEWLEAEAAKYADRQTIKLRQVQRSKSALASALRTKSPCGVMLCGAFAELPADCADWQIRDAARKFASFADIVETKSSGGVIGIFGGRIVMACDDRFKREADELYTQKTGGKTKARITK